MGAHRDPSGSATGPPPGLARLVAKTAGTVVVMACVLFGSAGTVSWGGGWLYLLLVAGSQALTLALVYRRHPDLITERSGVARGAKAWDVPLAMGMAVIGPIGIAAVAGLDVRYGWIGYVPARMVAAHFALGIAGGLLTVWAMTANPFFSGVVRIQSERGTG